MAENQTKIISVEAISTIAQLKDNIKELKKEIETLSVGSSDYNKRVVELAENQRALKLAMTGVYGSMNDVAKASKMDADSLNATVAAAKQGTATYNSMSSALSRLKQEIKDTPKFLSEQAQALNQVNPAYTELNQKIQVLDTSLKGLDADNGVFSRNVGNYVGALQEWGGTLSQVGQIGQQLTGGVMALLGIFSLFGAETEDTKEALQSIVPIFAVLNGAKGLQGIAKTLQTVTAGQKAAAAATAVSAAASTADAGAKGAETVATVAADTAQKSLNASMLANPVLAIVAGVIALTAAIAKYVSNANKAKKETEDLKKANEDLKTQFDEQNKALELQQRVSKAKGVSDKELIQQQINLKNEQIAATKAQLQNVQARLAQMKADSAWVRFWKGENKQIKNLEELSKNLTEQLKSLGEAQKGLQTDLVVNNIEKGKEAAEKLSKAYDDTLKNALSKAKDEIKKTRTEQESLNIDFNDTIKILDSGLTVVDKLISKEKDLKKLTQLRADRATIENGKIAAQNATTEAQAKIRAAEYTERIARDYKDIEYDSEKSAGNILTSEKYIRNVLGFTERETTLYSEGNSELDKTLERYKLIGGIIEKDILGMVSGTSLQDSIYGGLDWDTVVKLSQTDYERLSKNVGEPLATAIAAYVANENKIDNAFIEVAKSAVVKFDEGFQNAINSRDYNSAQGMLDRLLTYMTEELKTDTPAYNAFNAYLHKMQDELANAVWNDDYAQQIGDKISRGITFIGTKTVNSFDIFAKEADKFNQTYLSSTADALSAVGDLWEKSLQIRYKQQVESGKMTAEEAEAQAEKSFKAVKALQIGVATVDTATAIMRALSDASVPSYYVRAANAVAAGIAGAANIATIAMTNFGAPSVNTSNFATPTYTEAPSEMIYTYAINTADMAEANAQNPIRAYITDRDLDEGMRNYNNRQNETSF